MVFVNGMLMMPLRDYDVRFIKKTRKIVFGADVDAYSIVHIRYEHEGKVALTSIRVSYPQRVFPFRKLP